MMQTSNRQNVFVSGSFDDIKTRDVRYLEKASTLGSLTAVLWSDETIQRLTGKPPKFSQEERLYFVKSIRFVAQAKLSAGLVDKDNFPIPDIGQQVSWAVKEEDDTPQKRVFCAAHNLKYIVLKEKELADFTWISTNSENIPASKKKVIVTGCFDWLHSGHVRFFEETSALGDLYVVLGHDENVLLLKGKGHPLFPQNERRYMVQSIRFVKQALVSTGSGWMDAEPEILQIKPDIYAVNEDGDKPEKRAFCQEHSIEYVLLKRLPKEGLPKRESTTLRGF